LEPLKVLLATTMLRLVLSAAVAAEVAEVAAV